jgi:hypothetical protein
MHYIPLKYFFSSVIDLLFVSTIIFASHFPYTVYGLILFIFIVLFNNDHLINLYQFFHIQ